jgi:hypothetical protein
MPGLISIAFIYPPHLSLIEKRPVGVQKDKTLPGKKQASDENSAPEKKRAKPLRLHPFSPLVRRLRRFCP